MSTFAKFTDHSPESHIVLLTQPTTKCVVILAGILRRLCWNAMRSSVRISRRCVYVCVRMCVRACVRACVHDTVCVCVCVCVWCKCVYLQLLRTLSLLRLRQLL